MAESQRVLHSRKSLSVHSFMNVSDDVVVATELSEISKEILLIGKTSDLMIRQMHMLITYKLVEMIGVENLTSYTTENEDLEFVGWGNFWLILLIWSHQINGTNHRRSKKTW